jgi:SAM-dependent methyltransferase
MTTDPGRRLYGDLAEWWPLISPVEDYEEEAAFAAEMLATARIPVRSVLELGSGGGHNAFFLKARYEMTLVDLSPAMLAVSTELNPECEHIVGDMRDVRLGRTFDAVFIHDAIDYMTDERDLCAAMATASAHCRPGGVALVLPDHTVESFVPGTDHGGSDGAGRGIRYLEWTRGPDPGDSVVETDYVFLIRLAGGHVRVVHERHQTGLFAEAVWLDALRRAGFTPRVITEETSEPRVPRRVFLGHRDI